jgi:secreted trypsin-like serine protease
LKGYKDGNLVSIKETIIHPKYMIDLWGRTTSDVAIVILNENITTIQPVEVAFNFVAGNTETWARGWGSVVDYEERLSPVLKEIKLTTWNNTRANRTMTAYFERFEVDHTMMAAGGVKDEDACFGDSGGPLTVESKSRSFEKLVGIVSWGVGCGKANMPGIYTRLSAVKDFIENHCQRSQNRTFDTCI